MNEWDNTTAADMAKAAIWAEGTWWTAEKIIAVYRGYRIELKYFPSSGKPDLDWFCEFELKIPRWTVVTPLPPV